MKVIIEKSFDEFSKKMCDPEHAEKLIAKYFFIDMMRIFGTKKVNILDTTTNRINVEYRMDSKYVYLLQFDRTDKNHIEFSMLNNGLFISILWNDLIFNGIHKRIIKNWEV